MDTLQRIENENVQFTKLSEQILGVKCYGKAWSDNRNTYPPIDMLIKAAELTKNNGLYVLAVAVPVRTSTRLVIEHDLGITIYSIVDLVKKANLDQLVELEKYGDLLDKQ